MSIFGNSRIQNKQFSVLKPDKSNLISLSSFNPLLGEEETADKTKTLNLNINLTSINEQSSNQNIKVQTQSMSKDELKTNVILNWPYLKLHKETSKWLQERQYKRVWEILTIFYEKRKNKMSVTDRVLINRRLLCCANRILKEAILENEQENEEKINSFLDRAIRAVFESYRYLSLYITRIIPLQQASQQSQGEQHIKNPILDQNLSFLTSDDEYYTEPKKKVKTIAEVNAMYTLQNFRDLKLKYQKGHEDITVEKIFQMINLKNIELNLHLELDQFFINIISLFNWAAFMYKKFSKLRNAYWFLKEAERIGEQVLQNNNEELLNVISRVQIALANVYFEAGRTPQAIEKTEKSILVLQCELRLRQTKWEFHKSKDADEAISKCVKTLITSLINLATYQEELFLYEEAYFTIQIADWFSVKYIKGLDEVRKYCSKIQHDFEKRYSDYLQIRGDLEVVSKHVFWVELLNLYQTWEEDQKNQISSISKYINQQLYKTFRTRDLNKMQFIKHKFNQKLSLKELHKQQEDDKKKKDEVEKKYFEDMKERKNQFMNNPSRVTELQTQEQDVKNTSQVSQEQGQLDEIGRSRLHDKSNAAMQEKSLSGRGENSGMNNTIKKSSDQINISQFIRQNSFDSDQVEEKNMNTTNKVNSKQDISGNSQSDNTQIDLDDSVSSDDFFGDFFECFMSDDDDDSGKSKKSDDEEVSDSSLAEANFQFKQVQKKKLVKKKKEYGPNYNPKLLTTNMFFQPIDNLQVNRDLHHNQTKLKHTNKQAKDELKKQKYQSTGFKSPDDFKQELVYNFFTPIKEAIQEGNTKKEIIQQFIRPQTAYEYDFQGMDVHIESKLQEDLHKDGYDSKPYQWVKEDYTNEDNIESKYKREVRYTRRILNIKRISELQNKCSSINYSKFPNKITFDRMIKDEGFVIEAKVGFSSDIQQKKQKQDLIIQGEIKHQGKKKLRDLIFKNRDSYLFQDANYLKHVHYEYTQALKIEEKLKHQQVEKDQEKFMRQSQTKGASTPATSGNKNDYGQIVEKSGEYLDDSREYNRQSKVQLEDHEKSPISTKNYNSSLTQINNHFNNTLTSIPSEIGFGTNKGQSVSKKDINFHSVEPRSVKNQRLKWNIQEDQIPTYTISSNAQINLLTGNIINNYGQGGKITKYLDRATPQQSAKIQKNKFFSEKNSPARGGGGGNARKKYLDTSDNMLKLAGQKSKVLSKAQQIQKRYEQDQNDYEKLDNFTKTNFKDKLVSMSHKSNKTLKIVVDDVTQNLQKDKKQLQQTKFKLGVSKNLAVDDNFGQRLIEHIKHEDKLLTQSLEGISKKVIKDYMSFTEVVRLAKMKRKMELMAAKQSGSLTKF